MDNAIKELYEVIVSRRQASEDGSYTGYLFREGLDKILKKVGEEASETIIAAKSLQAAERSAPDDVAALKDDFENEVCDLLYHLLVLLVDRGVPFEDVEAILSARSAKTGNLKQFKQVDKNS
ncbi:MAG: phosphoribosyl-ATP diphosphatase [Clostridiales Family XIII bacterium]|jgi:phosphoribosyl-ATP pyrophosphohydrolase|nr:phosphoribosyl-ATP diphosphatase [Clostridiales Family XIII bacterium]